MGAAAAIPGVVGGVAPGAFGAGIGTGLTAGGAGLAAGGAGLGSLGTGLAAGSALAGGAGILSNFMAAAGPGLTSGIGGSALTPALASMAPAATSQALAPSLLQSAGLDALKSQAIGGGMLPGAGQGLASALPGAVNPAAIQAQGATNLARLQAAGMPIAKPFGAESMLADATGKVAPQALQTAPGFNEAGFRGLQTSGLTQPSLSAPQPVADATNIVGRSIRPDQNFIQNLGNIGSFQDVKDYAEQHPYATSAAVGLGAMGLTNAMKQKGVQKPEDNAMIRPYTYERSQRPEAYEVSPSMDTSERSYFSDQFVAGEPYKATAKADGGIASAYAVGGPVEQMAAMNSVGMNTGYPMASINTPMYSNPMMQRPEATNVIAPAADAGVGAFSGEPRFASGGISDLGSYSDGGRLLKGPGDGVSDSIPAVIGKRQPARLADGEFVVPARIVSELGNGSTEAGARKLYAMMDRIQKGRRKSVGKGKVAVDSKAEKHLPA